MIFAQTAIVFRMTIMAQSACLIVWWKGPRMFITFEGPDGSGKSTQIHKLRQSLVDRGFDVILTREPGGSQGAEEIRRLILEGDVDKWSAHTELLLFLAARRDHVERAIRPALDAGKIVLCDRYFDSTRAFQAGRSRDLLHAAKVLHELMIGLTPDLTLIFDIAPDVAAQRMAKRAGIKEIDRMELKGDQFQADLRQAFHEIAEEEPERCLVVDADRDVENLASEVLEICLERICDFAPVAESAS